MSEPYLILHKVRGEPTFDIAIKVMIGKEEGWIIPTSGHRAYPMWWWGLNTLVFSNGDNIPPARHLAVGTLFGTIPDHYDAKRDDGAHLAAARDILIKSGVIKAKPAQPLHRRM